MTNQKRGAAKLFYKVKKKWSGDAEKGGEVEAPARAHRGEPRGAVGRRGRPGAHEKPPPRAPPPREERPARRDEAAPKGPPEPRPLPGAMPLNQCIAAFQALLKRGLSYPNTYEDRLEGQTLVKLKNKNVVIALGRENGGLSLTCKLPSSGAQVVSKFSWATAAPYGLGRKSWVTARFTAQDKVPLRMLLGWVEESHRAVIANASTKARA